MSSVLATRLSERGRTRQGRDRSRRARERSRCHLASGRRGEAGSRGRRQAGANATDRSAPGLLHSTLATAAALRELLALTGLTEVVLCDELVVEVGREPECGKEVRVQEAVEPGDTVA
jgi:hypothetical protein